MPLPTQVHPNGSNTAPPRLDGQPPQPPEEAPKSPPHEPPKSHRPMALFGAIGALSLAVLALAAILILSGSHSSSQNTATPAALYQQKLSTALGPLVTANQSLSSALQGIDGSQHTITAAQNATTQAQSALAAARGAVAILTVPASEVTLSQQTQQALTQDNGYLQGVSSTLANPASQSSYDVRSLATNTQTAFVSLNSVVPGASASISGIDNFIKWVDGANVIGKVSPKQTIINNTTTVQNPVQSNPPPVVTPVSGMRYCDQNIQADTSTTCGLADNVFTAYWSMGSSAAGWGNATISAWSDSSQQSFDFSCLTDQTTVTCTQFGANANPPSTVTFPMSAVEDY